MKRLSNYTGRVVLGMSGGTDSSVCAMLLKEQGYEVIGVSLWFYGIHPENSTNPYPDFITEAQNLAQSLEIEHHVIDAREEFQENIVRFFVDEYLAGRTPSACIKCNPQLKWKLLIEKANELNCNLIATGHYIQIIKSENTYYVHKGKDTTKDQSYFLWNLNQGVLSRALAPLGEYTKNEVRELAKSFGFTEIATKKESMGVCFLEGQNYRGFIQDMIPGIGRKIGKGKVVNNNGELLGWHEGYPYYTIGQKKGLDLYEESGLMVSHINAKTNTLVLDKKDCLNKSRFLASDYYFQNINDCKSQRITTVVRGLGLNPEGHSKIKLLNNNTLEVVLEHPAWAVALGQPVAFYIGNRLIGGAIAE